jgi:tetratricopeptide (TPR) repeat protein
MMAHRKHAVRGFAMLIVGLGLACGWLGCQPSAPPSKSQKEAQTTLNPQAMEHFRQAHRFLAEQKLDEGLKEFQETVRLAPDSPLAYFWLGKVYFFKKDKEQAEKTLKKVISLDEQNYHALALLGKMYSFERDKLDQAQQYLQQSLELSPDNLDAHFDLGRVYAMKGDRDKALAQFRFIFNKEGDFFLYHFEMGRILEAWGEKERALGEYKRALVFNPQFEPAIRAAKLIEGGMSGVKTPAPPAAPTPKAPPPAR